MENAVMNTGTMDIQPTQDDLDFYKGLAERRIFKKVYR